MLAVAVTWPGHAFADGDWVFATPLVELLVHLVHLGRVEGPEAALVGGVPVLVLHLLKALVQREVVTHRILPTVRSCLN